MFLFNKSPICEALAWATACGRADPCPSGTFWVSPAEICFSHSLRGRPCEEGAAAEALGGGRKQKHGGTWQVECHGPRWAGWASPVGHREPLLTGLSRTEVQTKLETSICGHARLRARVKAQAAMLCSAGKRARDPSVILLLLLYGLRLPDGASPADKAGKMQFCQSQQAEV